MKHIYSLFALCLSLGIVAQDFDQQNLEDYIVFRTYHGRYSGVTLIYKGDQLVFESVKGLANRSWAVPNEADTRFNLASVTKMFTATAIGMLADQGKLEFDAALLSYLPDFPDQELARQVTIRQLLTHTSGLSDFFFDRAYLDSDRSRLRTLADYDQFLGSLKKSEVPQDRIAYSNTNYVILGNVIEQVSGKDYYSFMDEMIFQAAGMNNSGFFESALVVPKLAEGYFRDAQAGVEFGVPNDGQIRRNTRLKAVKGMPAGGAYATASDMHRFISALQEGALLKRESFEKMTTHNQGGYGMGFQTYQQNGISVWGHSGGFYGVSTMAFHLPDLDYTFISLTNSDFAAQPVFDRFINLLNGLEAYTPMAITSAELKTYEGVFEVYEGEMKSRQIRIAPQTDRLLFDNALEFYCIGKDQFFDIDNDRFTLTFDKDEKGNVVGFTRTDHDRFVQKARRIEESQVRKLQVLEVSDDLLRQYLGNYQFGMEGMMPGHKPQLEVANGTLTIDNVMRFKPYEKDRFFLEDDIGMRLEFQRNAAGNITGIHVLREKEVIGRVKRLN